jgi:F420H(2)-dependent biliverdin reductase
VPTLPPRSLSPAARAFLVERHLGTLTTLRADGSPHVVPVGFTYDEPTATARVITTAGSAKARHVRADPRVAIGSVDGARWLSLEGSARVSDDLTEVADAVRRYAARYRQPGERGDRVVVVVAVTSVLCGRGMIEP